MEEVASKILAKWRRVGVSLEIDVGVLDSIEKQRHGDLNDCFSDVFTYWQNHSTPQSPVNWATIVKVLRSNNVGEKKLSDTIRKKIM